MSTTALLTFAEFEQVDEPGKCELIDGELIVLPPPKNAHSRIIRNCERLLARRLPLTVWIEAGFRIGEHFAQPDVSVIPSDQPEKDGYWTGAPAIAIEVLSPANSAAAIQRKIELYLTNPIRPAVEVWLVDGKLRTVTVYAESSGAIVFERHSGPFHSRYSDLEIAPAMLFE